MRTLHHFEVNQIHLSTKGGADIRECLLEALALAIEENKDVTFTHNERTFVITPSEVVSYLLGKSEGPSKYGPLPKP